MDVSTRAVCEGLSGFLDVPRLSSARRRAHADRTLIRGAAGTFELNEAGTLIILSSGRLVNNSFLEGKLQTAEAKAVVESE